MQATNKSGIIFSIGAICALFILATGDLSAQNQNPTLPPTATAPQSPARHSPLPTEALQRARQAEQFLAKDQPDKAIEILQELDKQYPNQSAISRRLAEINDTLNRYGYALFYYRRYIQKAGPRARGSEMALARVASLEMMAGIDDDAEAAAKELGETTRPIATPTPQVKRTLSAEAKDGTLIPITNEKDFERLQKQGVPQTAPSTPIPTPEPAIVIPPQLARTPAPVYRKKSPPQTISAASNPGQGLSPTVTISGAATATPRPPDEDALLAEAFRQANSPDSITKALEETNEKSARDDAPDKSMSAIETEPPNKSEDNSANSSITTPAPRLAKSSAPETPAPRDDPAPIAFTKETPTYESARAAHFFNISQTTGSYALVALVNELKNAVVTVSITPADDSEVISAILMPGENRTLYVPPAHYTVSAKASTTDYSPITLMSTHFKYTFQAARQYTHRFNHSNQQVLN